MQPWFRRLGVGFICVLIIGCNRGQSQAPVGKAAAVGVAHPVVQEITDYEDIPGRTEAKHAVDLKARVTGYLEKDYLHPEDETGKYPRLKLGTREGTLVQEGDPLFLIDQRQFKAELAKAEATVFQSESRVKQPANDYSPPPHLLQPTPISHAPHH